MFSTIAVTFNPRALFSSQRIFLGTFPIYCFLGDNSPEIEYLIMLLHYTSGVFTKLIDEFIEFMNKESVLYNSALEYTSDMCSEADIRIESIHSELSRYGNIKTFQCLLTFNKVLISGKVFI